MADRGVKGEEVEEEGGRRGSRRWDEVRHDGGAAGGWVKRKGIRPGETSGRRRRIGQAVI